MRVAIIEDEKPAAEKLVSELAELNTNIIVVEVLQNVKSAIQFFEKQPELDLVFMDVELTDGLSFDIFDRVKFKTPIIFITAYDHYWQKALTLNGIDYLLKPITLSQLEESIRKFDRIRRHFSERLDTLLAYISGNTSASKYKEKFLIRKGRELAMVQSKEIVAFKSSQKMTLLITRDLRKLIIDESLVQLEEVLDPRKFTRANRAFIINIDHIDKVHILSKGKVKVSIKDLEKEEIIISQERASEFKKWLEQN